MKGTTGTITHLQLCVARGEAMQGTDAVRAIADLGFEGDTHAKKGSARQILIMDEETLSAFGLAAGRVRENITLRGIDLKPLPEGTHLRAGEALFEITKPCTPCKFIEDIRPGLRAQMDGQRGMLARVIQGGEIHVGDRIEILG